LHEILTGHIALYQTGLWWSSRTFSWILTSRVHFPFGVGCTVHNSSTVLSCLDKQRWSRFSVDDPSRHKPVS
jgi:hypothetical protein